MVGVQRFLTGNLYSKFIFWKFECANRGQTIRVKKLRVGTGLEQETKLVYHVCSNTLVSFSIPMVPKISAFFFVKASDCYNSVSNHCHHPFLRLFLLIHFYLLFSGRARSSESIQNQSIILPQICFPLLQIPILSFIHSSIRKNACWVSTTFSRDINLILF